MQVSDIKLLEKLSTEYLETQCTGIQKVQKSIAMRKARDIVRKDLVEIQFIKNQDNQN